LPSAAQLSVIGYSLGGHLATAFNLLYPDAAQQVVTFNGAGVGRVTQATLSDVPAGDIATSNNIERSQAA
jgi:pimeloyl-ACP methyl ester carboxylesterase